MFDRERCDCGRGLPADRDRRADVVSIAQGIYRPEGGTGSGPVRWTSRDRLPGGHFSTGSAQGDGRGRLQPRDRHALAQRVKCRAGLAPVVPRHVFFTSTAGSYGEELPANYAAAKSGVIAINKVLTLETAGTAIRTNVIAPQRGRACWNYIRSRPGRQRNPRQC